MVACLSDLRLGFGASEAKLRGYVNQNQPRRRSYAPASFRFASEAIFFTRFPAPIFCDLVSKMSQPTVKGIVHVVEETKTFGQKGFRKRLVVLEQDNGRFQSYIPVEFIQDACDQVDGLKMGDEVEVTYRLNGRKWQRDPQSETKYFLSAEAQSFRVLSGDQPAGGNPNDALAEASYEEDGDVPF